MKSGVKRKLLRHLLMVAVIMFPSVGWTWGKAGHEVIGYIAERDLCDEARISIAATLDGQNLAAAGYWADKIRGDKEWQQAKPWHYINIPDGVAVADAERVPEGDVLSAIAEMNRRLDDESLDPEEQAAALRFLIHFVGDIHQPLHVGRKEDLGGNRTDVRYYVGMGEPAGKTNLHMYWDTEALDLGDSNVPNYAARISNQYRPGKNWDPGTPEDWAEEAMALRPEVYNFHDFKGGGSQYLGREYEGKTQQIIGRRLSLAGFRLADMLNARYCSAAEDAEASE